MHVRPPHLEHGVVLAGTGAVKGHIRDLTRSTDHEDLQRSRHLAPGQHGQIDEFGLLKERNKKKRSYKMSKRAGTEIQTTFSCRFLALFHFVFTRACPINELASRKGICSPHFPTPLTIEGEKGERTRFPVLSTVQFLSPFLFRLPISNK